LNNRLLEFDYDLFHKINHDWTNPFLDRVLPFVRESVVWVPLYLFLVVFGWVNYGRKGYYWILAAIATVVIANFISSDIIKVVFYRDRPCRDSLLEPAANLLINRCPISSSFTSSHAVNHFSIAMFLFQTMKYSVKKTWLFFIWAFLIIYAQVYVGVHFPVDVIFGALIGCTIGYTTSAIFNYRAGILQLKPVETT
jgi:membrane-associated phospholipid phosphatase